MIKKIIFAYIFLLVAVELQAQSVPDKFALYQLTENCYVHVSARYYNGSPVESNGLVVVEKDSIIIIDTPWDSLQTEMLLATLQIKFKKPVSFCIATHSHSDRTGGLNVMKAKGIKTYTTYMTDSISAKNNEQRAINLFLNDTTFNVDGLKIESFYPGQGHAPDNIVVYIPKYKVLYGGCLIKSSQSQSIGNTADANLKEWKNSIYKAVNKFPNFEYVIVGHGETKSLDAIPNSIRIIDEYNGAKKK